MCDEGSDKFGLQITSDEYPDDVTWAMFDGCSGDFIGGDSNPVSNPFQTYAETFCLPTEGYYFRLTIYDSWGDGLLEGGSYSFSINGEVLDGSNVPYSYNTTITVGDDSVCGGGGGCTDPELKFKMKKNPPKKYRTCDWVADDPEKRCKSEIKKTCPDACGKCKKYKCKDSPLKFKVKKEKRDCEWISKKPRKRCEIPGVALACPGTCSKECV